MYNFLADKTVLYIEDELEVLRNISSLLNHFFDTVYLASDAETGLQLFFEKRIDVLLIDIELPGINGIELIKQLRKTNKHIPIIIISAYTNKNYLLDAVELNLSKYIVKPLTSAKIQSLLNVLNDYFTDDDEIALTQHITLIKNESVVCFTGNRIKLTQKELNFLIILARKKSLSYEEIHALWKDDTPTQNAIRTFIKQLRKKLPEATIKTANDLGYYLESVEIV
jgi:DNA-binding response OmpR family regulator